MEIQESAKLSAVWELIPYDWESIKVPSADELARLYPEYAVDNRVGMSAFVRQVILKRIKRLAEDLERLDASSSSISSIR